MTEAEDPNIISEDAAGTSRNVLPNDRYCQPHPSSMAGLSREPFEAQRSGPNLLHDVTDLENRFHDLGWNDLEAPMHGTLRQERRDIDTNLSKVFATVARWEVYFDGKSSLTNFLTRIGELRYACGITKPQLFRVAVVLFRNSALSWFRAFGESSGSWDDLVNRLKEAFLPASYDEELWKDIRSRTQHSSEKSVVYISVMENYFGLLRETPLEVRRVEIIRGNMLPIIQQQIAVTEARLGPIDNLYELVRVCQRLDEVRERIQRYRPPPMNPSQVVEPGLMFREPSRNRRYGELHAVEFSGPPSVNLETQISPVGVAPEVQDTVNQASMSTVAQVNSASQRTPTPDPPDSVDPRQPRRQIICYNCRQPGHMLASCTASRVRRCYNCGQLNQTVRTCPNCSGNGNLGGDTVGLPLRQTVIRPQW